MCIKDKDSNKLKTSKTLESSMFTGKMKISVRWGYCTHNSTHNITSLNFDMMKKKERDLHYKIRHIRLSDEVYEELKLNRQNSGKSWNLYIRDLIAKTSSTN